MSIVGRAIWHIETNLAAPLTLAGLATVVEVTPFHLARSFAVATGSTVMRYVWRRRLSRAAEALAYGSAPLIEVALDAGYASPEAFARAFRMEMGLSPSALRRHRRIDQLTLTHPLIQRTGMATTLAPPTVKTLAPRRLAGPVVRYDMQTRAGIPAQWAAYNDADVRAPSPSPEDYFGVVFNYDDEAGTFDYLCGQEVPMGARLPAGFAEVTISGVYACFASSGHISTMGDAWSEIYTDWLARPELRPRSAASVEYYPPAFNGETGEGGFELWLPIEG